MCRVFVVQKEDKWRFLKDALWGDLVTCSRRGLPRAVWGSGKGWLGGFKGGRPGPWLQERVGGGVHRRGQGLGGEEGGGGAWLAVLKRGKSREGLACLAVPQEGARARGIQALRFRKGRCVIFRKLEG